jgi:nitrite reductase/ring-hydroxylating ferredoxin subunit/ferredoxin
MMLREFWYAAAVAGDVGRKPLARIVCGTPVVLYRTESGQPVALHDLCSHRRAPLSLGRTVGDSIECPYHGLVFNPAGHCTFIPSQDTIPAQAHIRAFPVQDRHGFLWIWMGAPENADTAKIPDLPWRDAPDWNATTIYYYHVRASHILPATALGAPRPGMHVYICGPTGFMTWVSGEARAAGWPADQLHMEYFTADVETGGAGLFVEARRSGKTIRVDTGQTIAAALLGAGVVVPLSCEQGVCGTCLVGVLDGIPDHRDVYQTDDEKAANTHIACCCSRALSSSLVLDI